MEPASAELRELERQLERSSLFTHTALSRNSDRIDEIEGFVYGLIDVLVAGGVATPETLREAVRAVRDEIEARGEASGPGLALRVDEDPGAAPRQVDCAERIHVCQAVCCRLDFALNSDEVEGGMVKWDLGRPYFIRHAASGYCHHIDETSLGCGIYAVRPQVCRRYSCEGDTRIWDDFERMQLNHAWIDTHLGPDSPTLLRALMHRKAQLVDPRTTASPGMPGSDPPAR